MQVTVCLLAAPAMGASPESSVESKSEGLLWSQLPDLPDPVGVAGPFTGVHNNVLIVAGGANFPDGVPWHPTADGSRSLKQYHDEIYVLQKTGSNDNGKPVFEWTTIETKLPRPIAYGLSVPTDQGLLCIGGEWQEHKTTDEGETESTAFKSDQAYLLQWDPESKTIVVSTEWKVGQQRTELPRLPKATTAPSGGRIGEYVYFAGGDTGEGGSNQFLRLKLLPPASPKFAWKWEEMPTWNGPPRFQAIGVVQSNKFFLFSGRNKQPDNGFQILKDAYCFDPADYDREASRARRSISQKTIELASYANGWKRLASIQPEREKPARCVMAGSGVGVGYDSILIFGGAPGDLFLEREQDIPRQIEKARSEGNEDLAKQLDERGNALYDNHAGFSSDILQYNITSDSWAVRGKLPFTSPVTTTAVEWGDLVVIPSGEKKPGVRTAEIWSAKRDKSHRKFGTTNWIVLGAYLAILVGIGFLFSRRESSSDDFFLAGGRIPWWAAGLSIFGTMLSAITYLSIPARAYASDWSWTVLNFGIPVVAVVVVVVYLPRLLRVQAASAYEFLEQRFDISLRLFASVSFVLFQLGRMGIVVLLPALALSAVTGVDLNVCIITMGVLSTVYTVLGGIEAVVWTDVVQVVVLIGGAFVALGIICFGVDGGLMGILTQAYEAGKLNLVHDPHFHDLSWAKDGAIVMLLGAFFNNLVPYTSDQSILQRYLAVSDEGKARRAIWTNAIMCIPATILFFLVGTALWAYYKAHPIDLAPLTTPDQIFPWFIAQELPPGIAGLVIAGVFAAAMSSLDSSMHSAATVITTDFHQRFRQGESAEASLSFARWATVVLGILGTGSALILAMYDIRSLWEQFQAVLGLLLGTVGGLFSLGILTKRVNTMHAWLGVASSVALLVFLKTSTNVNSLLYAGIAVTTCMVVGMLSSMFLPESQTATAGVKGTT